MIADLKARPLTYHDAHYLATRIRQADIEDLLNQDADPLDCLLVGLEDGEAWGIWDGETLVGAGGYTAHGAVWSLWTDLSPDQSRGVMSKAVGWAKVLRMRCGEKAFLQNVYAEGNRITEAFLKATHCVTIHEDTPLTYKGRSFIPFFLKPLEALGTRQGDLSHV